MDTHEKFLENLRASEDSRWLVARYLSGKGNIVRVPPLVCAPTHADWKEYADEGDLEISLRVEVKRISRNFSGPGDWPFGTDFIVCAFHAWERAAPKPAMFWILSQDGTTAAVVRGSSRDKWRVEKRGDSRYEGRVQEFLFAPLSCVEWTRLADGAE